MFLDFHIAFQGGAHKGIHLLQNLLNSCTVAGMFVRLHPDQFISQTLITIKYLDDILDLWE